MICLVCGKTHDAAECPRCGFPDIQIMGDREKEMARLMPFIQTYKTNLLKSVTVSFPAYRWKDQNGLLAPDRTDWLTLGHGDELLEQERWLPEKYARIADQKAVTVSVRIACKGESREVGISVPNLLEPELQQLGGIVNSDCTFQLMLKNTTKAPTSSAPVPLFE